MSAETRVYGHYEYKIDMTRDLRRGDEFKVMVQRSIAPNGTVRIDSVLAATFHGLRGRWDVWQK